MNYNNKLYTFTYYLSNFSMHFWDILHGTDFSYIDKSVETSINSPYYATPWASIHNLRQYIKNDLDDGKNHKVIDLGCGKGYMLYIFSMHSFDKVSGIEYSRHLKQIASRNLRKLHMPTLPDIYRGDASLFREYSKYDVFYLYNPFDENTLQLVLGRIMDTLYNHPRTLYLIYCNPLYENVLVEYGWKEVSHFYYKTKVYIYEK